MNFTKFSRTPFYRTPPVAASIEKYLGSCQLSKMQTDKYTSNVSKTTNKYFLFCHKFNLFKYRSVLKVLREMVFFSLFAIVMEKVTLVFTSSTKLNKASFFVQTKNNDNVTKTHLYHILTPYVCVSGG